jgi:hypothetical protein
MLDDMNVNQFRDVTNADLCHPCGGELQAFLKATP